MSAERDGWRFNNYVQPPVYLVRTHLFEEGDTFDDWLNPYVDGSEKAYVLRVRLDKEAIQIINGKWQPSRAKYTMMRCIIRTWILSSWIHWIVQQQGEEECKDERDNIPCISYLPFQYEEENYRRYDHKGTKNSCIASNEVLYVKWCRRTSSIWYDWQNWES